MREKCGPEKNSELGQFSRIVILYKYFHLHSQSLTICCTDKSKYLDVKLDKMCSSSNKLSNNLLSSCSIEQYDVCRNEVKGNCKAFCITLYTYTPAKILN